VKIVILLFSLTYVVFGLKAQQRDLNYYLEKAKTNSPLINKNRNESRLVTLDLQQINSVLCKPEINVVSAVMFAPIISHDNNTNRFEFVSEGAEKYSGYDLASTDGGQYQAVVSVRQPLLTGSKYRTYSGKAGISGQISENNIALTMHELEQVVRYQYILCIRSKVMTDHSLKLLNELREHLKVMQNLVEHAVYRQTDRILLEIEVQNYQSDYKTFESEYMTNLFDLNLICGLKDTGRIVLQDIELAISPLPNKKSNFLTSFRLDSLNITADQAISELKYKPQLDLYADAGMNAIYIPSFNRLGFSTGLTFNWNIFDGRQRDIQRAKSAISLETLEFEKNHFMTQNEINKNKILNQVESTNQRMVLIKEQMHQYDILKETYTRELSQGEISVMDFKNLLRDFSVKKQEFLQLEMERQILINSYNYLNY
jgi:outer membrane protein TolC